ncbi:MAG: hypothetical protein IKL20_06760 [Alistipes sp.]|nr:hypothetical protein [Alistipes sp.]
MKISMKKYWWIALVILLMPIALNFILLTPSFTAIVGDEIAWLSFWGGYLGAIISTTAAFIILYIQRKDNESENEKNRADNETQNKQNRVENKKLNRANRQLQLNIMKYHQQSHWLDEFRNASLAYCSAFNHNDLVMISNIMWLDPNGALERIKLLFDRVTAANATFSFVRKQDSAADKLATSIGDIDTKYREVLNDVQYFVLYYAVETEPNNRQHQRFHLFLQRQDNGDGSVNRLMNLLQQPIVSINNWDYFRKLVWISIATAVNFEADARDKLYEYIKQEQEDINKLLTENIES